MGKTAAYARETKGVARIVVTGHKDSLNNGTMLVFLGLLAGIREVNSDIVVTLISDHPEEDRRRYGTIKGLEIILRPWRKRDRFGLSSMAAAAFCLAWTAAGRIVEPASGGFLTWPRGRLGAAFEEADLAADVSGDDLTSAYGLIAPLQVLYELTIAKLHRCRTILPAYSVGPFHGGLMKLIARAVRSLADDVTLRESSSLDCWKEISPGTTEVDRSADLMFLVETPSARDRCDGGPVAVNISRYIIDSLVDDALSSSPESALDIHLADWKALLRHIHSETGRPILLLPHTFRQGKNDDRHFLNLVLSRCPADLPVSLAGECLTAHEVQRITAGCSFVVTSRLHLALTALNCGVPFLALSYSHKYEQLLYRRKPGPSPVIDVRGLTGKGFLPETAERFSQLWKIRDGEGEEIRRYARECRMTAKKSLRQIFDRAFSPGAQ